MLNYSFNISQIRLELHSINLESIGSHPQKEIVCGFRQRNGGKCSFATNTVRVDPSHSTKNVYFFDYNSPPNPIPLLFESDTTGNPRNHSGTFKYPLSFSSQGGQ